MEPNNNPWVTPGDHETEKFTNNLFWLIGTQEASQVTLPEV